MKYIAVTVLIAFLVLFCLFAILNHDADVHSDPDIYLSVARSLASGDYYADYPPQRLLTDNLPGKGPYKGFPGHIIKDGRAVPFVGIAYPLFLSLFFLVDGIYAALFANAVVFVCFFIVLYIFAGILFKENRNYQIIAVVSLLVYFLINRDHIIYLLRSWRDPLSFTLMLGGFCSYLKFFGSDRKKLYLALTALLIGLSVAVRETSAICLLPMGLLYLVKGIRNKALHPVKYGSIFIIFLLVGSSILLVQNYVNTGNPLYPTQSAAYKVWVPKHTLTISKSDGTSLIPGTSLKSFPQTSTAYLKQLWHQYGIVLTALFFLGVLRSAKRDEIRYFLVPFIITYFIFYGFYYNSPWRYLFVIHMTTVPIIAFGAMEILDTTLKLKRKYLLIGLTLCFLSTAYSMFAAKPEKAFRLTHARRFKNDLNSVLPANSLIIAERKMRSNIDYFTDSYCVRFDDFVRPEHGITVKKGLQYYMKNFENVFFFDSKDRDYHHIYDHTPITRQKILDCFDLVHCREFDGETYNLEELFGRRFCTLWKLERWRENVVSQNIEVDNVEDCILRINARKLWNGEFERENARLYLNDRLFTASISDGINYFNLPKEYLREEESTVKLTSDAPLPRHIDAEILDLQEDIVIYFGAASIPLDTNYIAEKFITANPDCYKLAFEPNPSHRDIVNGAKIKIPTVRTAQAALLLHTRMMLTTKANDAAFVLTFLLNGKRQAERVISDLDEWQWVKLPLSNNDIKGEMSELTVNVRIADPHAEISRDTQSPEYFLSIDRFVIRRYKNDIRDLFVDIGAKDNLYVMSGFHDREAFPKRNSVRWTRGTATVNLPSFQRGSDLLMTIIAFGAHPKVGELTTEVSLNSHRIGEMNVKPEIKQSFQFRLPEEILSTAFNELVLKTPTWSPSAALGTKDHRELGIAVDSIRLWLADENEDEKERELTP